MSYKDPKQQSDYQNQWKKNRRLLWIDAQGGRCVNCGSSERLEIDHVDPSKKISHNVWSWAEPRRLEELAKCQVLCYYCHKGKTTEASVKPIEHGTINCYRKKGCRCQLCTDVASAQTRHQRSEKLAFSSNSEAE